jgi:putative peptide zinc metalloprotease protein
MTALAPPTITGPALRRLPGTEPLGRAPGSGLREPPFYLRRIDGQIVAVSELLYAVACAADAGASDADVAAAVGARLAVRISAEQARYVLETKLHPLGVVSGPDGRAPALARVDPLLGIAIRRQLLGPGAVGAIARVLAPLFHPLAMIPALALLLAFDVWAVLLGGRVGAGLTGVIDRPALGLVLFALMYASLPWHESGHAAACRFGGARPGAMGAAIYFIWPAMYTDLTDAYRLGRGGRLRTDLGGIYFNGLYCLALGGIYLATGFTPLLIAIVAQHALAFQQFMPWLRLDGYYVVADAIGVPDLFARIRPVLRGLRPGRGGERLVAELLPRARVAVTAWVLGAVVALVGMLAYVVIEAPHFIRQAWASLVAQVDLVAAAGSVVDVAGGVVGIVFLLLPVAGMLLTYVLLCRRAGSGLAVARVRAELRAEAGADGR